MAKLQFAPDRRLPHRDRRPRLHQLLAGREPARRRSVATILEQGRAYGRATCGAGPQGQRRVRLRQSRPARCTSATGAAPRWATRSRRCYEWTGHACHPRVLHQRRRRPDRQAGGKPLGADPAGGGPRGRDPRGRLPRRVPDGERPPGARGAGRRRSRALPGRGGDPPLPRARRSGCSARSRIATSPTSACAST